MSPFNNFVGAVALVLLVLQLISLATCIPISRDTIPDVDQEHASSRIVKVIVIGILLSLCAFLAFYLYRHWKPMTRRSQPRMLFAVPESIYSSTASNIPMDNGARRAQWFSRHASSFPRADLTVSPPGGVPLVRDIPRLPGQALKTKVKAPTASFH